jgi:Na+/H+-dicarboxylate symporter
MTRFRAWLRIAAPAMLVAIGTGSVAAATPSEFSIAERRLFVDDHLRGIHAAATLEYTFSRLGSIEGPYEDTATLRIGAP